jgi:hypothetical protein
MAWRLSDGSKAIAGWPCLPVRGRSRGLIWPPSAFDREPTSNSNRFVADDPPHCMHGEGHYGKGAHRGQTSLPAELRHRSAFPMGATLRSSTSGMRHLSCREASRGQRVEVRWALAGGAYAEGLAAIDDPDLALEAPSCWTTGPSSHIWSVNDSRSPGEPSATQRPASRLATSLGRRRVPGRPSLRIGTCLSPTPVGRRSSPR